MRRLGVVVVLALAGVGVYRGVDSLSGDGAGHGPAAAIGPESTTTSPVVAAVDGAGGSATTVVAASTTAAPTTIPPTEPEQTGPPTEDNPAEVLVVGDSDAGTFAPYLERLLDETGIVDVELAYVVSSGLARPDFHNWPRHLRELLASSDPDIIIVTFGGNDAQGLLEKCADDSMSCNLTDVVVGQVSESNADEWTAEYVDRVHEVMDIMTDDSDRRVIWVGIPNAEDPAFTERLQVQDQAVRRALEDYSDAVFVDTWERFDGPNNGIAELVVDPRDGKAKRVRQGDGFHLNEDGAFILAIDIKEEIVGILEDLGADL